MDRFKKKSYLKKTKIPVYYAPQKKLIYKTNSFKKGEKGHDKTSINSSNIGHCFLKKASNDIDQKQVITLIRGFQNE
jgi:hypothetical protein